MTTTANVDSDKRRSGNGLVSEGSPSASSSPPSASSIRIALQQLDTLTHLLNLSSGPMSQAFPISDILPSLLLPLAPLPVPPPNLALHLHPAHTAQLVAQQRRAHYKTVAQQALAVVAQLVRETKVPSAWSDGPDTSDTATRSSLGAAVALVQSLQAQRSVANQIEARKERLLQVRRKRRKLQEAPRTSEASPSVVEVAGSQERVERNEIADAPTFVNMFGVAVEQFPTPLDLQFAIPAGLQSSQPTSVNPPDVNALDAMLQVFDKDVNSRNSSVGQGRPSFQPMFTRSHLCDVDHTASSHPGRAMIQIDIRDVLRAFIDVEFHRHSNDWSTRIINVNVRAPSEYDALASFRTASRLRPAHSRTPSRFPFYRGISAHVLGRSLDEHARRMPRSQSDNVTKGIPQLFPLWTVLQHLVAFRCAFDAPPPNEAQFRAEQAQAQQARAALGLVDGNTLAEPPSPWFVRATLPTQVANARWAWCVRERAREERKGADCEDQQEEEATGGKDDETMHDVTQTAPAVEAAAGAPSDSGAEPSDRSSSAAQHIVGQTASTSDAKPARVEEGEWRAFHPACAVGLPMS